MKKILIGTLFAITAALTGCATDGADTEPQAPQLVQVADGAEALAAIDELTRSSEPGALAKTGVACDADELNGICCYNDKAGDIQCFWW